METSTVKETISQKIPHYRGISRSINCPDSSRTGGSGAFDRCIRYYYLFNCCLIRPSRHITLTLWLNAPTAKPKRAYNMIINLDRIAASTRSVGLHVGPQHIDTNISTTNQHKLQ